MKVAAKSGSLLGVVRNEIAVAECPDGGRYAVAVFTRADVPFRGEGGIADAMRTAALHSVDLGRAEGSARRQLPGDRPGQILHRAARFGGHVALQKQARQAVHERPGREPAGLSAVTG